MTHGRKGRPPGRTAPPGSPRTGSSQGRARRPADSHRCQRKADGRPAGAEAEGPQELGGWACPQPRTPSRASRVCRDPGDVQCWAGQCQAAGGSGGTTTTPAGASPAQRLPPQQDLSTPQATLQGPTTLSMGRWLAAPPCSTSERPPRLLPALRLPAAHLDLGLHLLGPSQFLGLGDGRGEKLGFKGWLGGVGDLLWLALSGNLLCCDLRKERPPRVRAGKALGPLLRAPQTPAA